MLDQRTTDQADLHGGKSPWQKGEPQRLRANLLSNMKCDVLIVGAGITGSMMAEKMTREGRDVCVVDREKPGLGSTAASTAMLLWEIDRSLTELSALYGFEKGARIYRRSFEAAQSLSGMIESLQLSAAFYRRHSLLLAAQDIGARELSAEHDLRRKADLPGELLSHATLLAEFGMAREAALVSPGSAEADPVLLSGALLNLAIARGARLFDAEAMHFESGAKTAAVHTNGGHIIEADHVVLATGYSLPDIVSSDLHQITSSWAMATAPQQPGSLWRDKVLIWEASKNYLYARTTNDNRIVIGGEDDPLSAEPEVRDAQTASKAKVLAARLRALWPNAHSTPDLMWSGAFGTTKDGLPLLGSVPKHPRYYAAYGYGGNGITFSFLATQILASLVRGERHDWFDDFAIDRSI